MGTFSQRLTQARKRKQLSQAELSSIAGVSTTTLSAYENNGRPPALDIAKKLADALDVSLDWLADTGKQAELTDYSKIDNVINALAEIADKCACQIYVDSNEAQIAFIAKKDNDDIPFLNKLLVEFFNKWEKVFTLYKDGTIDNELYDAWFEKTIRTFKTRQLKYEITGTDELTPEDLHDDESLLGL